MNAPATLTQQGRYRGSDVVFEATIRDDADGAWTSIEAVATNEGVPLGTWWADGHSTATDLWRIATALQAGDLPASVHVHDLDNVDMAAVAA